MKIFKKSICFILILVMVLGLAACSRKQPQLPQTGTEASKEPTTQIIFSKKLLKIANTSPEAWIESLETMGENQYTSLSVGEDGNTVCLEVTANQQEFWKTKIASRLADLDAEMKRLNSGYGIEAGSDYQQLTLRYNLELDVTTAVYYVLTAEVTCAFEQLLNGAEADGWYVAIEIINADTGKTVTTGDSEIGLTYESSDWEASK